MPERNPLSRPPAFGHSSERCSPLDPAQQGREYAFTASHFYHNLVSHTDRKFLQYSSQDGSHLTSAIFPERNVGRPANVQMEDVDTRLVRAWKTMHTGNIMSGLGSTPLKRERSASFSPCEGEHLAAASALACKDMHEQPDQNLAVPLHQDTGLETTARGANKRAIDDVTDTEDQYQPYSQLIFEALMSAPRHEMLLSDIYDWFEKNTTKPEECRAKGKGKGWHNSVRHNLSMNQIVIDSAGPDGRSKKGHIWRLSEDAKREGRVKSTTRYRKQSSRRSPGKKASCRSSKVEKGNDAAVAQAMASDSKGSRRGSGSTSGGNTNSSNGSKGKRSAKRRRSSVGPPENQKGTNDALKADDVSVKLERELEICDESRLPEPSPDLPLSFFAESDFPFALVVDDALTPASTPSTRPDSTIPDLASTSNSASPALKFEALDKVEDDGPVRTSEQGSILDNILFFKSELNPDHVEHFGPLQSRSSSGKCLAEGIMAHPHAAYAFGGFAEPETCNLAELRVRGTAEEQPDLLFGYGRTNLHQGSSF